ncbi:MAG: alanine--tRNA ligase [Actinomycetota bacterium]|nr:alanine--tRNA ligase [Actinomycetota bacterium]
MRTTAELREGFLQYFESKGHTRLPSTPLIPPPEDTSTLLISAGMQPLKPYFLGVKEPPAPLLTTYQKCFRSTDIDEVGLDGYHLSFFEMMGNFSIGEYFKEGAVELAWEFLVDHLAIDLDKLWVTVFDGDPGLGLAEDEVAIAAWEKVGMPRERIVGLPRSENFWQAGETGPCGPCSEMYYDRGEALSCGKPDCGPGCSCERYLEFWNLVFMEFDLAADGKLTPLPKPVIDTGLGLERAAAVLQSVISVYETDGYQAIMDWIEAESGVAWRSSEKATKAHRIIADHGRGMTFLVANGVLPSNEGRGYVLRRVIRRAVQQARGIGLAELWRISDVVTDQMSYWYSELEENRKLVQDVLKAEEERFSETLERGLGLFEEIVARGEISGADAFKLHDTYGFPLELTRELALERGLTIDEEEFTRLMAEQRERSRAGAGKQDARSAEFVKEAGFTTEFVGWERTDVFTQIGALAELDDGTFLTKLRESPFYPEGGGQVSDTGYIELDDGSGTRAELVEAYRFGDDQVLLFQGSGFAAGDRVRAVVSWPARFPTMANHTGTHLLHQALREVLGDHVRQAGSAVRPDKIRFDFTHPQALTAEERHRVEHAVNEAVFQNRPVRTFFTTQEEARNLGAMMLFGEKYGDEVRVVEIDGYSRELCGGTHVRSTAEVGSFAILSEGSVGSGARRIEAVTSGEAFAFLHERAREAEVLRDELQQAKKDARKQPAKDEGIELEARSEAEVGGINIYVGRIGNVDMAVLLAESDRIKQERSPAAVVLGSNENGQVHLVANFDKSLENRVNAVEVIKVAAAEVGGGGGGRPTMARAGGNDPAKLDSALEKAEEALRNALG